MAQQAEEGVAGSWVDLVAGSAGFHEHPDQSQSLRRRNRNPLDWDRQGCPDCRVVYLAL